jgi:hypothetical protein
MGLTFKQLLAADIENVFTNPNEFGEQLTYKPKDGVTRTINGVVDEDGDYVQVGRDLDHRQFLDVFVSRDSTTGIDDPQLGDAIRRAIDPDGKWYSYQGQKSDVDENAWTLRFVLDEVKQHGGHSRV